MNIGEYVALVDSPSQPEDVVLLSYSTDNFRAVADYLADRGDVESAVALKYAAWLVDRLRQRLAPHLQGVH